MTRKPLIIAVALVFCSQQALAERAHEEAIRECVHREVPVASLNPCSEVLENLGNVRDINVDMVNNYCPRLEHRLNDPDEYECTLIEVTDPFISDREPATHFDQYETSVVVTRVDYYRHKNECDEQVNPTPTGTLAYHQDRLPLQTCSVDGCIVEYTGRVTATHISEDEETYFFEGDTFRQEIGEHCVPGEMEYPAWDEMPEDDPEDPPEDDPEDPPDDGDDEPPEDDPEHPPDDGGDDQDPPGGGGGSGPGDGGSGSPGGGDEPDPGDDDDGSNDDEPPEDDPEQPPDEGDGDSGDDGDGDGDGSAPGDGDDGGIELPGDGDDGDSGSPGDGEDGDTGSGGGDEGGGSDGDGDGPGDGDSDGTVIIDGETFEIDFDTDGLAQEDTLQEIEEGISDLIDEEGATDDVISEFEDKMEGEDSYWHETDLDGLLDDIEEQTWEPVAQEEDLSTLRNRLEDVIPDLGCSGVSMELMHGQSFTITCNDLAQVRSILSWVMYALTAFALFNVFFEGKPTAK